MQQNLPPEEWIVLMQQIVDGTEACFHISQHFYFSWLKTKWIYSALPISITLISNHPKWKRKKFLHESGIIHQSICPEAIMICDHRTAKLGMLCFSRMINDSSKNWEAEVGYNPHIPNIDAISGALITLSLSILNSQCEEGAIDGIDIWYMTIITYII